MLPKCHSYILCPLLGWDNVFFSPFTFFRLSALQISPLSQPRAFWGGNKKYNNKYTVWNTWKGTFCMFLLDVCLCGLTQILDILWPIARHKMRASRFADTIHSGFVCYFSLNMNVFDVSVNMSTFEKKSFFHSENSWSFLVLRSASNIWFQPLRIQLIG